ncbi:MAG: TonB-dependent receptor [Acetobacter persici]
MLRYKNTLLLCTSALVFSTVGAVQTAQATTSDVGSSSVFGKAAPRHPASSAVPVATHSKKHGPAYFLMDVGLTFAAKSNKWSISAYANNIIDRRYDITRETGLNGIFGVPGTPRMVGGRMRIDL